LIRITGSASLLGGAEPSPATEVKSMTSAVRVTSPAAPRNHEPPEESGVHEPLTDAERGRINAAQRAEAAKFSEEWAAHADRLARPDLGTMPLPLLLMRGLTETDDSDPIEALVETIRGRVETWAEVSFAVSNGSGKVELNLSALEGIVRVLDVVLELRRREAK
jgi:hypothetical protein